jgi:hypothetical protein
VTATFILLFEGAVSKNSCWQEKNGLQEGQYGVYRNPEQAEWDEQNPNDGIGDERQEGDWPAENEEKEPTKKAD